MTTVAAAGEINRQASKTWWQSQRAKRVGSITLAISLMGVVAWWFFFHPYVSTDDARAAMTLVRVAPAGVGGRIDKIDVTEGDRVKAGQLLAELDHRIPRAQVDRARAKAQLGTRELDRMKELYGTRSAPKRDLDNAIANSETAQAELALAEVILENTFLKSPFDGVVVQKSGDVGNILEPGQAAITIADVDHAWIAANIEETSVADVKVGQPVTVHVDEGGALSGHVSEVGSAAASQFALIPTDNASGNFTKVVQRIPIKIELDPHGDRPLRAGQSVEIRIRVR